MRLDKGCTLQQASDFKRLACKLCLWRCQPEGVDGILKASLGLLPFRFWSRGPCHIQLAFDGAHRYSKICLPSLKEVPVSKQARHFTISTHIQTEHHLHAKKRSYGNSQQLNVKSLLKLQSVPCKHAQFCIEHDETSEDSSGR